MGSLVTKAIGYALLAIAAAVAVLPILWTLINSFKELHDIITPIPVFIFVPTLENYSTILGSSAVLNGLKNSVFVVFGSVFFGAILGIPAAYAIARSSLRAKAELQFFFLSMRFTPPVAIAVPLVVLYLQLNLYDSVTGLVLVYLVVSLATIVWLSVPAFARVPLEIEEAARMDGCSSFVVMTRFAIPVALPSLFGALVFTFVLLWNELLLALILTAKNGTLPVVAAAITSLGKEVPWGVINATTIILTVPPLLVVGLILRFIKINARAR